MPDTVPAVTALTRDDVADMTLVDIAWDLHERSKSADDKLRTALLSATALLLDTIDSDAELDHVLVVAVCDAVEAVNAPVRRMRGVGD